MITETDERVAIPVDEKLKKTVYNAFNTIIENLSFYKEYEWGIDRLQVNTIRDKFDELIMEDGYEIDERTRYHKYGIGNNNRWEIVNSDLECVGYFNCNSDMYGGVYIYLEVNGEKYLSEHLR